MKENCLYWISAKNSTNFIVEKRTLGNYLFRFMLNRWNIHSILNEINAPAVSFEWIRSTNECKIPNDGNRCSVRGQLAMTDLNAGLAMRCAENAYANGGHAALYEYNLLCGFNLLPNSECLRERKQINSTATEHNQKSVNEKRRRRKVNHKPKRYDTWRRSMYPIVHIYCLACFGYFYEAKIYV